MYSNIYLVRETPILKEDCFIDFKVCNMPLAIISSHIEVSDNPKLHIEQLGKWLSQNHLGELRENCILLSQDHFPESEYFESRYLRFKEIAGQLASISYERFINDFDWIFEMLFQVSQQMSDAYEDYVCWDSGIPVTMSEFLRKAQPGTPYYIGGIYQYHY